VIKSQNNFFYTVVNVLNIYIHWKKSTYPKLIICDVQLKYASTILLLRMLHQNNWLSRRKSTCWWVIVCSTLSAHVSINYRLPIKVYYCICTVRHIRIKIIHGSQNVFSVLNGLADISILTRADKMIPWFIS